MIINKWDKVFKNRLCKICGRQPIKSFSWSILEYFIPSNHGNKMEHLIGVNNSHLSLLIVHYFQCHYLPTYYYLLHCWDDLLQILILLEEKKTAVRLFLQLLSPWYSCIIALQTVHFINNLRIESHQFFENS